MPARPIETLMEEHRIIEKALSAMLRCAAAPEAGGVVDPGTLREFLSFLREFADACHHGKEEHRLFPVLVEKGLPAKDGPIPVMCAEHKTGRRLVGELEDAIGRYLDGHADAAGELAAALGTIADFCARQISKEDNVLFPLADPVPGADEVTGLIAAFEEVDGRIEAESRASFTVFSRRLDAHSDECNPS